jgi:hypothetical protein
MITNIFDQHKHHLEYARLELYVIDFSEVISVETAVNFPVHRLLALLSDIYGQFLQLC